MTDARGAINLDKLESVSRAVLRQTSKYRAMSGTYRYEWLDSESTSMAYALQEAILARLDNIND